MRGLCGGNIKIIFEPEFITPLKDAYSGVSLGKGDFIEEVKKKISMKGRDREIGETRFTGSYTPDDVIYYYFFMYSRTGALYGRRSFKA